MQLDQLEILNYVTTDISSANQFIFRVVNLNFNESNEGTMRKEIKASEYPVSLQLFVSCNCVDECACIHMYADLYVWQTVEV